MTIRLTPGELRHVCHDLSSELLHDMGLNGQRFQEDDFAGILKAWREYSPRYVTDAVERTQKALSRGLAYRCDVGDIEATRAMHDETAALLEKLLRHFR